MAKGTYATFTLRDSRGKTTTRRYQARDAAVTDAQVVDLATDLQALTKLSVVEASVSRAVDISAVTTAPVAGCSKNDNFNLRYEKSLLRNSHGGVFTFNVPELQDALVNSNGTIVTTANEFDAWRENFDDGDGTPATQGIFYVSDGEELVEDAEILGGEIVG